MIVEQYCIEAAFQFTFDCHYDTSSCRACLVKVVTFTKAALLEGAKCKKRVYTIAETNRPIWREEFSTFLCVGLPGQRSALLTLPIYLTSRQERAWRFGGRHRGQVAPAAHRCAYSFTGGFMIHLVTRCFHLTKRHRFSQSRRLRWRPFDSSHWTNLAAS